MMQLFLIRWMQILLMTITTVLLLLGGTAAQNATCEICGCSFCPTGFMMQNPNGMINITQQILEEFGGIMVPGGEGQTLETILEGFEIRAGSVLTCSLLNTAAISGVIPLEACVDTLRLNPIVRDTCGCPALPPPAPTTATKAPTIAAATPPPSQSPSTKLPAPVLEPTSAPNSTLDPVGTPVVPTKAPVVSTTTTEVPVATTIVTTSAPVAPVPANGTTILPPLTIIGAEGNLTEADFPLEKCQGDCNRNRDCTGNLLCFQRGGATTIPGCSGRAETDGIDYCWDPTDKPLEGVIAHIGNNGNPTMLFPLPRCAGQCTSDSECSSGLVCLFRDRIDDPVYGCKGPLVDRIDYCVDPNDIPGSNVITPTTSVVQSVRSSVSPSSAPIGSSTETPISNVPSGVPVVTEPSSSNAAQTRNRMKATWLGVAIAASFFF